ncbi:MAG: 50S ribosomal protein L23 [Bacillota bacterium]
MNLVARDIIITPLVTEKTNAAMARGTYSFRVHPDATKADVHNAIEEIFKVRVTKVNTMNVGGKPRRLGLRKGRTRNWKKAMVTLAPGQKIPFFEGV